MKPVSVLAVILLAGGSIANAVDLNKDALKSMQQEGHKIVEESQAGRVYKTSNGLCLDRAGVALLVKKCNGKATQKWRFDDKSRLVASDKRCVAGTAQLQKCGTGSGQKWKLDGKKRLANAAKKCLQVPGSPIKAGAKVVVAACTGATGQKWK